MEDLQRRPATFVKKKMVLVARGISSESLRPQIYLRAKHVQYIFSTSTTRPFARTGRVGRRQSRLNRRSALYCCTVYTCLALNAHVDSIPMAVRIRLALSGQRHNRIYHIVASPNRLRRDGKPIETLGVFNPHLAPGETTRKIEWSADRIRYWLGVGAIPTPAVSRLLALVRPTLCTRTCFQS